MSAFLSLVCQKVHSAPVQRRFVALVCNLTVSSAKPAGAGDGNPRPMVARPRRRAEDPGGRQKTDNLKNGGLYYGTCKNTELVTEYFQ